MIVVGGTLITTIIAVSRIKEKYILEGINEYIKRLTANCRISIKEVDSEKIKPSVPIKKIKDLEAAKIMQYIGIDSCIVALDENGNQFSSVEFAQFLKNNLINSGKQEVCFIIGGANGLSQKILEKADYTVSLSKLTFPHQMVRLIILEQLYRAFKIINNEPYHK